MVVLYYLLKIKEILQHRQQQKPVIKPTVSLTAVYFIVTHFAIFNC